MGALPMSWDELAEMGAYEGISKEDYLNVLQTRTRPSFRKTGQGEGLVHAVQEGSSPSSEGTLMLGRTGEPVGRGAEGKSYVLAAGRTKITYPLIYLSGARGRPNLTEYGNIPSGLTPGRHSARPSRHVAQPFPYLRELLSGAAPVSNQFHPETAAKYGVEWTSSGCGWKAVAAW